MNSQPVFPHFKPLEMEDRSSIEAFTRRFDPYSDFCFSTLILYDGDQRTRWCWLNGNLVLYLHDGFGPGAYLTFLGCAQVATTAQVLINYAVKINCAPILRRVPEVVALAIPRGSDGFYVEEDRDCFDYVYQLTALVGLEEARHYGTRRGLSQFKRRHPNHRFVPLDLCDPGVQTELRTAMSVWQLSKSEAVTMRNYCRALEYLFRNPKRLDLITIGLAIDDSLTGFAVTERIENDWLLSHFAVANPAFTGLSVSLLHHLAQHGSKLGCAHLNYQEDLGDKGLRYFKTKCCPSGFLRKFSIKRKKS